MTRSIPMCLIRCCRFVPVACVLVLAAMFANPAAAVLIVNDTWQDATRTDPAAPVYSENGINLDPAQDSDLESAWYRTGTGSTTTMSAGHMVNNPSSGSSMSLTTYVTPEAAPISLTNVGEIGR